MTSELKSSRGPTALINGASDGIGHAVAEALATQDFDLVMTDNLP